MAFRSWFPLSLDEQAAFYRNFTRIFSTSAVALGFSAEDVASLQADNAMMQFLAKMQFDIEAYKKGFQLFRDNMTKGLSENADIFRPFPAIEAPPAVEPNMFDRLFFLSDRIIRAKNYHKSLGVEMGILPKPKKELVLAELEPKLKVKPLEQAEVEVRFVRGKTSGVNLYFKYRGDDKRYDLGKFFHSPVIVKIPLREEQKPEQIMIFASYVIGNKLVGKVSPMTELIVAP